MYNFLQLLIWGFWGGIANLFQHLTCRTTKSISGTDIPCIGQLLFLKTQSEVDIFIEKGLPK